MLRVLFAALWLVGCGGGTHDLPDLSAALDLSTDDAAATDGGTILYPMCTDSRADAWPPPVSKTTKNGLFKVTLMSSTPSPPQKATNLQNSDSWDLMITDASGAPVPNAIVTTFLWMPDHGHGTMVTVNEMAGASSGQYTMGPLFLFMPGLWQVTFTLQADANSPKDTVMFSYCIDDGSI